MPAMLRRLSVPWTSPWAMAWAWRCAPPQAPSLSTWPMASATNACVCTSLWVLRFEHAAGLLASTVGLGWPADYSAGHGAVRFLVLGAGHAGRHPLGLDHDGRATGWPRRGHIGHDLGRRAGR